MSTQTASDALPRTAPATIEIRTDTSAAAWDGYLATRPDASFYHLHAWHGINETQLGHKNFFLSALAGGITTGVLPLVLVESRLFGRILCSMPFVNFGGPCADEEATAAALIAHARKLANDQSVDYLELRCTHELAVTMPVSLRKVSMTIDLDSNPDTLWNAFSSKHRKNVKRAYKNELEVRNGGLETLDTFYAVIEESWRALGTPLYRKQYFDAVLRAFPDSARIYICYRRDEPLAVGLVGAFNGVAEGLWAGTRGAARQLDANYVLYWEMIRDCCTRGYRQFHLGRSTADSGGEEFKKKWNATSKQLYWYYHRPDGGPLPALNVDNPKYKLAIAAWRRMPLWATRMLGPPISRLIP